MQKRFHLFGQLAILAIVAGLALTGCSQPAPAPTAAPAATEAPAASAAVTTTAASAVTTTAASAVTTTAASAVTTTASSGAATQTFELGVDGPFSGPDALNGTEFKRAFDMAMSPINYTIGNYKIDPVFIDDQSDPAKATTAFEQAYGQKKIQAMVLNWNSSTAVALMEETAKYKVPEFFGFGATETVNETFASNPAKYGYWMLKGWPSPAKLSVAYVSAIDDAITKGTFKPANKTVALGGEDSDWGHSFCGAIKSQFQAQGWTVVDEEYFPIDQTEFTPLMTKLKNLNPAVFVLSSTAPPTMSAAIKQESQAGVNALTVADGLGWVGNWYTLTGKASDYVLDEIPQLATAKGKAFVAAYQAKYNVAPSASAAGLAYDGTNMFIEMAKAVEAANNGQLTGDGIYQWVKANVWTGQWTYKDGIVMPEYKYTADTIPDPVVGPGEYMFPVEQYFGGQSKIVYPADIAVQALQGKP
jgi:branched-chain amino acid transport system substrate-binding protein